MQHVEDFITRTNWLTRLIVGWNGRGNLSDFAVRAMKRSKSLDGFHDSDEVLIAGD
jgi:hypothetical protein